MTLRLLAIPFVLAATSMNTLEARAQEPHEQWMQHLIGDWTYSWPDLNISGQVENTMDADRNAVVARGTDQDGPWVEIIGWQSEAKKMVFTGFGAAGNYWNTQCSTVGPEDMSGTTSGILPDGRAYNGTFSFTRPDDDTFQIKFSGITDGEKLETSSTFKRKTKPRGVKNSDHLAAMEYFIGSWKSKSVDGANTDWTFAWGRGRNHIKNELVTTDAEGNVTLANSGMLCWDKKNHVFVNRCVGQTGNPINFNWRRVNDKEWAIWVTGSQGEWPVIILDKDTWQMTVGGDAIKYERVNP